jgi:hypothetical protein
LLGRVVVPRLRRSLGPRGPRQELHRAVPDCLSRPRRRRGRAQRAPLGTRRLPIPRVPVPALRVDGTRRPGRRRAPPLSSPQGPPSRLSPAWRDRWRRRSRSRSGQGRQKQARPCGRTALRRLPTRWGPLLLPSAPSPRARLARPPTPSPLRHATKAGLCRQRVRAPAHVGTSGACVTAGRQPSGPRADADGRRRRARKSRDISLASK